MPTYFPFSKSISPSIPLSLPSPTLSLSSPSIHPSIPPSHYFYPSITQYIILPSLFLSIFLHSHPSFPSTFSISTSLSLYSSTHLPLSPSIPLTFYTHPSISLHSSQAQSMHPFTISIQLITQYINLPSLFPSIHPFHFLPISPSLSLSIHLFTNRPFSIYPTLSLFQPISSKHHTTNTIHFIKAFNCSTLLKHVQ